MKEKNYEKLTKSLPKLLLLVLLTFSGCEMFRYGFNQTIELDKKTFLEYFTDGSTYQDTDGTSYTYTIDDGTSYLGEYSYNDDGDDMTGTFGQLVEDTWGTQLIVTVDSEQITIETVVIYSEPSEKLIELLIYKSLSCGPINTESCEWFNTTDNIYYSYFFTLNYKNDTITYDFFDVSDFNTGQANFYSYLYYKAGGDDWATFEGEVGGKTIKAVLTSIKDNGMESKNTLNHVIYIDGTAPDSYKGTYYSNYPLYN